jgi:hypothetical protein
MDMRGFAPKRIKPDNVREGPVTSRIIAVLENEKFGRPMLELENGSQFMLNQGNNTALMKAWGHDSDDWIGQEVEFTLGTYKGYDDEQNVVEKETVKVRAVSPAKNVETQNGGVPATRPLPPSRPTSSNVLDDDIPF